MSPTKSDQSIAPKEKSKPLGFGFIPDEAEHHFLVTLGGRGKPDVLISEHMIWSPDEVVPTSLVVEREDARLRVMLSRQKWDMLEDPVRVVFNRRLKQVGLPPGQWKGESVPLSRPLGKELVLLAWAVEDADPSLIADAVLNWKGLQPEERWWLYTMTCAATGHVTNGRGRGWRRAIRYALTENPVMRGADLLNDDGEESFVLVSDESLSRKRGRTVKPSTAAKVRHAW